MREKKKKEERSSHSYLKHVTTSSKILFLKATASKRQRNVDAFLNQTSPINSVQNLKYRTMHFSCSTWGIKSEKYMISLCTAFHQANEGKILNAGQLRFAHLTQGISQFQSQTFKNSIQICSSLLPAENRYYLWNNGIYFTAMGMEKKTINAHLR